MIKHKKIEIKKVVNKTKLNKMIKRQNFNSQKKRIVINLLKVLNFKVWLPNLTVYKCYF